MKHNKAARITSLVVWDACATYLAYLLALVLVGGATTPFSGSSLLAMTVIAILNCASGAIMGLYTNLWEHAAARDALRVVAAPVLPVILGAAALDIAGAGWPPGVHATALLLLWALEGGARYLIKMSYRYGGGSKDDAREPRKRTMVVGAGETGSIVIDRMNGNDCYMQGKPVVAVDDDPEKIGMRIQGVPVAGGRDDIPELAERYRVEQIVLALPSAPRADIATIREICVGTGLETRTMPDLFDVPTDRLDGVKLRDIDVADLLPRKEVVLDTERVMGYIAGRTVLVTGGGGSIGSELVRQICTAGPARIVVFDIYENTAYELQKEIQQKHPGVDIVVEIGSVRDEGRVEALFERYRPEVVFHAAAHKHVPLMEACPREAVLNNVFGTWNVAQAADRFGAERFILISTDKAVNPSCVMGATKKFGEMIVQSLATTSSTVFAAVRFGNVLGSHGSVIPLFERQIAEGGPVTVTHPDMTRYFMTIPEASRLVIQAGGIARGGEIFILEMGEPVKIDDLARNLIRLSGLRPDIDIQIEYTGLRPGEKIEEELWTEAEEAQATSVEGIMISNDEPLEREDVERRMRALADSLDGSNRSIKECLAEQVPGYTPRFDEEND